MIALSQPTEGGIVATVPSLALYIKCFYDGWQSKLDKINSKLKFVALYQWKV